MTRSPRGPTPSTGASLIVRALRRDDWPTVERLFGGRGACGGCWCMWWRVPRGGKAWEEAKGEKNRAALRRLVESGQVHAMVAFDGEEPVGWCSFGPRATFPRLETVRALRHPHSPETWSITCFYIPSAWRGRGVATQLLEAATSHAFAAGASEIEAYPVVPMKPTAPAAFVWTGVPRLFERAGFERREQPGETRPLYAKVNPGRRCT